MFLKMILVFAIIPNTNLYWNIQKVNLSKNIYYLDLCVKHFWISNIRLIFNYVNYFSIPEVIINILGIVSKIRIHE